MTTLFNSLQIRDFVRGDGIDHRVAVRATSTGANVNLAADLDASSLDGVTLAAGDRVLLRNQTTPAENGIYNIVAGAGNSYRAEDLDAGDAAASITVHVSEGTVNGKSAWVCTNAAGSDVVGTDDLVWTQQSLYNYVVGDLFYATSGTDLAVLNKPAVNSLLQMDAAGTPVWVNTNDIQSGLDFKESVRFGTLDDLGALYNAAGGSAGTGELTTVTLTNPLTIDLDGETVAVGDRILVKNQSDPQQNGIYVVTDDSLLGVMERAPDQDGDPVEEVSGGNFVFVELGAALASSGWVLQGDGVLTLNTDDLVWVQFSASASFTGGDGIDITGSVISADLKANGGLVFESAEIAVDLGASNITGTLAVGDGGTGVTSITAGSLIIGDGTNPVTELAPVSRKVLISNSSPAYALSNVVNLSQINGAADDLALVTFTSNGSAVNNFAIENATAGSAPNLSVVGTDTNIDVELQAKGTGTYDLLSTAAASSEVRLFELTGNGSNFVGLKARDDLPEDLTFVLPDTYSADGNVMTTNGSGELNFRHPGSLNALAIMSVWAKVVATSTSYQTIATFPWENNQWNVASSRFIFYEIEYSNRSLDIRVQDITNATTLGSDTGVSVSGFRSFAFSDPGSNARIEIQVRKGALLGVSPTVHGIQMYLNDNEVVE